MNIDVTKKIRKLIAKTKSDIRIEFGNYATIKESLQALIEAIDSIKDSEYFIKNIERFGEDLSIKYFVKNMHLASNDNINLLDSILQPPMKEGEVLAKNIINALMSEFHNYSKTKTHPANGKKYFLGKILSAVIEIFLTSIEKEQFDKLIYEVEDQLCILYDIVPSAILKTSCKSEACVKAAIRSNPHIYKFLPREFKDVEFAIEAVSLAPTIAAYLPKRIVKDQSACLFIGAAAGSKAVKLISDKRNRVVNRTKTKDK